MTSIRRRLLVWLLVGFLAATALAGAAIFVKVREEAGELLDMQLKQIALSQPDQPWQSADESLESVDEDVAQDLADDSEIEDEFSLQVWSLDGELLYTEPADTDLPRQTDAGFATLRQSGQDYRVFVATTPYYDVQVAQPLRVRDDLAADMALRASLPLLAFLPLLAVLAWVTVGRSLKPLVRLAAAVEQRSPAVLHPLPETRLPPEVRPLVVALNDLLRRLDQALGAQRAFVGDAAHALRTPLTAILMQAQLVERAESDVERRQAFATLNDGIRRSIRLVNQLLTLARQEPDVESSALALLDMATLIKALLRDYEPIAQARQVALAWSCEAGLTILGDGGSLTLLLANLVDNAIRYTPGGGSVTVRAAARGGGAMVEVIDSGPGIPPDQRHRVFDRFYRSEATSQPGSGLGLAIARRIAERHGATIELLDPPQAPGLLVRVVLPPGGNQAAMKPPSTFKV